MTTHPRPDLSPEERDALAAYAAGPSRPRARRARIILAYAAGQPVREIARREAVQTRTVYRWIGAFTADRMGIFTADEPGEPPASSGPMYPPVSAADPMSEAGRAVLGFYLERFLKNEPVAREGQDIEGVHRMRVSVRRMRAALRVFGPYFQKRTRRWLRICFRYIDADLGPVRDLDVLLAHAQGYLGELPEERRAELDPLLAAWGRQHERARRRMIRMFDGKHYLMFIPEFQRFCETPGLWAAPPPVTGPVLVRHMAAGLIYSHYEAVRSFEGAFEDAPLPLLHALRLENKYLRYTLEAFRGALGPEADDVIAASVRLQDHLGALQDAGVAIQETRRAVRRIKCKAERAARKATKKGDEAPPIPDLSGVRAYRRFCKEELARLRASAPEVWGDLVSEEMRRSLALAVSAL